MRLQRLRLQNWRGVSDREVAFAPQVTLIEGTNEIGKSSLIEALLMLFRELDSSKKVAVRAVKPVGLDVGSTVEVELVCGPFHFTYAKTFHRATSTVLQIRAPRAEQLTGREAHERVLQMLDETMDTQLWQALQLEQGSAVAQARLQDSQGLARALDQVANAEASGAEDAGLIERVAQAYREYFTERRGEPRFKSKIDAVAECEARVAEAQAALQVVEDDVQRLARLTEELHQVEASLPELERAWLAHQETCHGHVKLKVEVQQADRALAAAQLALEHATMQLGERRQLRRELGERAARAAQLAAQSEPQRQAAGEAADRLDQTKQTLQTAQLAQLRCQAALETAEADLLHSRRCEQLRELDETLDRLAEQAHAVAAANQALGIHLVTDQALQAIHDAHGQCAAAEARLDAALPTIEVEARRDFALSVDGTQAPLKAGQIIRPGVGGKVELQIADLAIVRIASTTEATLLEERLVQARAHLEHLFGRHRVTSVGDALASNAARQRATEAVARSRALEREIRKGRSADELGSNRVALQGQTEEYDRHRAADPPLPASIDQGQWWVQERRDRLADAERQLASAQQAYHQAQQVRHDADLAYQLAEQQAGLIAAQRAELEHKLERTSEAVGDQTLVATEAAARTVLADALAQRDRIHAQLRQADPPLAESLRDNAKAAWVRAQDQQRGLREQLAGLRARLDQAQTEAWFEQLTTRQAALAAARTDLARTERQAAAVRCLLETLQRHRQAARQAYVRPLSERINSLGRIVFGPDFAVELDEQLTMVSRTRRGQTVPFDDLSVGAREQMGILARLAAAQLVAPQGGVPLIVDDALGYSDPERLQTMGAAIAQVGKQCQIVILTCSPGRYAHVGNASLVKL